MRNIFFLFLVLMALVTRPTMAGPSKPWSFLIVLDNSGSMRAQRAQLSAKAPELIQRLKDQGITDFRIAVTTTDFFTNAGQLISNSKGIKVVEAHMADAGAELAGIVNAVADSPTSFWEQGLESARTALEKESGAFLRDGDQLAVMFISDEDDYSCEKDCFGPEPEHNPNWTPYPLDRYTLFFWELKRKRNIDTQLFPIVGILEGSCAVSSYGVKYVRALSQLGGMSRSICPLEFEASLFTIIDKIGSTDAPDTPKVLVDPILLPPAHPNNAYTAELSGFVQASGILTFSLISAPSWMRVSSEGTVSGVPTESSVGTNQFRGKVCNQNGACAEFGVHVIVDKTNHPPVWAVNPLLLPSLRVGQAGTWDLNVYAADPDGDPLVCRASSLPTWLRLQGCTLTGVPRRADVGTYRVELMVTDGQMTAQTVAVGKVTVR
jgi:hypothetical protein